VTPEQLAEVKDRHYFDVGLNGCWTCFSYDHGDVSAAEWPCVPAQLVAEVDRLNDLLDRVEALVVDPPFDAEESYDVHVEINGILGERT
jgi:hypothetical protein